MQDNPKCGKRKKFLHTEYSGYYTPLQCGCLCGDKACPGCLIGQNERIVWQIKQEQNKTREVIGINPNKIINDPVDIFWYSASRTADSSYKTSESVRIRDAIKNNDNARWFCKPLMPYIDNGKEFTQDIILSNINIWHMGKVLPRNEKELFGIVDSWGPAPSDQRISTSLGKKDKSTEPWGKDYAFTRGYSGKSGKKYKMNIVNGDTESITKTLNDMGVTYRILTDGTIKINVDAITMHKITTVHSLNNQSVHDPRYYFHPDAPNMKIERK